MNSIAVNRRSDRPRLAWVVATCGAYALLGGVSSFAGWALDIRRLTDWYDNGISIQPNAAICVALSGLALVLLSAQRRSGAAVCGAVVALIGGATLAEWFTDVNLGIDSLLLFSREWGRVGVVVPGRMGPPGSVSWTLLGTALLLLATSARARPYVPFLALLTLAISLLSITGYLYGASILYTMPRLTVIALQTATFIAAISVGLVASVPERQPMRLLLEDSTAGLLARRALPVLLVGPLVLGGLRVLGQNAGLFDTAFGTAVRTVIEIIALLALLWWSLSIVSRHEKSQQAHLDQRKKAEEASARLAAIVASSDDAIISKDLQGVITSWNAAAQRLFGYSAEEIIGQPVTVLIPADHLDEEPKILERIRRGEGIEHYETVRRRKDGTTLEIALTVSPIRDSEGRIIGASKIVRDITQRKRIEEDRQKFVALVESSTDFIGMCDLEGRPFFVNRAGLEMVGLGSIEEARGKHVRDFFFPEDQSWIVENFFPALLEQGHGEVEVRFRHFRTGDARWMAYKVLKLTDAAGQTVGFATVSQDVTERRRLMDDLSQADRRKDEFLATLAHELRNPLAPLRHTLEILKQWGDDAQTLQQARDTMERQLGQMIRLVDDLLDLSRITRDKLELRMDQVELAPVLRQAVEACQPLAEQAGHTLHVVLPPEPVYLHADPVRLAQVFSNLLNNSCKYTPPGGQIWLRAERQGSDVAVTVKDTGTGIPPDKLESIFDMFTQIDRSLERSQGGLGIGLTLVKRLVQMHGGSISAKSDGEGRGSEFEVRLPVVLQPVAEKSPESAAPARPASRRCILIVDDNRDAAISLGRLLKMAGNETHTAHDGEAALEAVERLQPEVVVLDIGLPKLNGYEVCRRLRERPGGKGLVLVALTGWGQEEDRRKSHEAGFNGHLVKPVDFAQLTKLLNSLSPAGSSAE